VDRLSDVSGVGIDVKVNSKEENVAARINELTGGRGVDLVIEAAGRKEAWESAYLLSRKGGTVLLFGGCSSGTTVSFDAGRVHYGELTLQGSFHHTPSAVETAFRLLASGKISTTSLISNQMPLSRTEEALQLMASGRALKIALRPD
jgi:L-iditol 2-dehydrogenase